jgi:hypothetical protein
MTNEETIEQLKQAGFQMFTALTVLNALHHETERDDVIVCAHCSALADAIVEYPCPTVQVLLNDVTIPEDEQIQED